MAKINVNDVPESQHTLYMRGFSTTTSLERIKAFFGKESGASCSYDFFKQSPDRRTWYVAIRFATKDIAREVLLRFNGREIFGSRIEMKYFKDIRKYVAVSAASTRGRSRDGRLSSSERRRPAYQNNRRRFDGHEGSAPQRSDDSRSRSRSRSDAYVPESPSSPSSRSSGVRRSPLLSNRRPTRSRSSSSHDDDSVHRANRSNDRLGSESPPRVHVRASESSDDKQFASEVDSPDADHKAVARRRSLEEEKAVKAGKKLRGESRLENGNAFKTSVMVTAVRSAKTQKSVDVKSKRRDLPTVSCEDLSVSYECGSLKYDGGGFIESGWMIMDSYDTVKQTPEKGGTKLLGDKFRPIPGTGNPIRARSGGNETEPVNSLSISVAHQSSSSRQVRIVPAEPEQQTSISVPAQTKVAKPSGSGQRQQLDVAVDAIRSSALANCLTASENPFNGLEKQPRKKRKRKHEHHADGSVSFAFAGHEIGGDRLATLSDLAKQTLPNGNQATVSPEELMQNKRQELEEGYRSDCDTFLMVVRMLISKDPSLENPLLPSFQACLEEIGQKYLQELDTFVQGLNSVI